MSRRNRVTFEVEGLDEITELIKKLGDFPDKLVTGAAKAGAEVARKAAKANAPADTGNLRKGIILRGERKKGAKKVYQIIMDPKMNDVFVKMSASGERYYYPASIEYGFYTKNGKKVPGVHFLKRALTENHKKIAEVSLRVLGEKIDKELKKSGKKR